MDSSEVYTPALGRPELTGRYDAAIRFWTREGRWRPAFARRIAPAPGETILDVGCGTGSLAVLLKSLCPKAQVVGMDPDPEVLAIAEEKARRAGLEIELRQGFAREAAAVAPSGGPIKVVSSLVFHQVPMAEKIAGVSALFAAARGGSVHVADYARQSSWLMRRLFRATVQRVDGRENTQPNADGVLEDLLSHQVGGAVHPYAVFATPSGSISLFELRRPPA